MSNHKRDRNWIGPIIVASTEASPVAASAAPADTVMRRARRVGAIAVAGLLGLLVPLFGGVAPASADTCPNEALRQQQGVTDLPDCMALEQVTPPVKFNRRAGFGPSISAAGDRVLFFSPAALGEVEGLAEPVQERYVATRGSEGWATRATAPPASFGFDWGGATSVTSPLSYTPEFDRWLSLKATVLQASNGQMTLYEAALGGPSTWTPRSPLLVPLDGHHGKQLIKEAAWDLMGASRDLGLVVVRGAEAKGGGYSTAYKLGDPQPQRSTLEPDAATFNNYVLTRGPLDEPQIALMAEDDSGKAWGGNCGAFLGGGGVSGQQGGRNQGSISADGSLVYFSTRPAQPQPGSTDPTYPRCVTTATAKVVAGEAELTEAFTAKGTGTTSESSEPDVLREVSTSAGAFEVGQTIEVTGSTVAPGTTITAVREEGETHLQLVLSNPVSAGGGLGKALKAGAAPLAVGETISSTSTCGSAACFAPGTTITAVGGDAITVSPPPIGSSGGEIVVNALAPLRIMRRAESPTGDVAISELLPSLPAAGSDYFEGASEDQQRVYFTSSRALVPGDKDPAGGECSATNSQNKIVLGTSLGCDLYLYEETSHGPEIIDVSEGDATDPTRGENAGVFKGVTAISGDGSHVYFAAQGALTEEANPEGEEAVPPAAGEGTLTTGSKIVSGLTASLGEFKPGMGVSGPGLPENTVIESVGPGQMTLSAAATANGQRALRAADLNLFSYTRLPSAPGGGTIAFVGALDSSCTGVREGRSADCLSLAGFGFSYWNDAEALPMLGDGHVLLFQSTAPLTANDTDGRHLDVFRYDSSATPPTLGCVSCLPGGEPDSGGFDVVGREGARSTQEPGLEFAQSQRWADESGDRVVFATAEALLPGAVEGQVSDYLWQDGNLTLLPGSGDRPTISQAGTEVAFETPDPLLPGDGDSAVDVYMARADGGFPLPPETTPCEGEACQGQVASPPAPPEAGTSVFEGRGNPTTAPACPKNKVKRKGRCVKKHHRKKPKQRHKKDEHHKHSGKGKGNQK